jgi:hypothetical protein
MPTQQAQFGCSCWCSDIRNWKGRISSLPSVSINGYRPYFADRISNAADDDSSTFLFLEFADNVRLAFAPENDPDPLALPEIVVNGHVKSFGFSSGRFVGS